MKFEFETDDIGDIAKLQPNWDGYGALVIHPDAIEHARTLHSALTRDGHIVTVTPNPNGTVSLEWAWKRRTYSLEVGKSLISGYVKHV